MQRQIKTISKSSMKRMLLGSVKQQLKTLKQNTKKRFIGVLPYVPFTTNHCKFIQFKSVNINHPALTIIDMENKIDVTEQFYKQLFGSNYKLYFNVHLQVYDFYDWYCQYLTSEPDFEYSLITLDYKLKNELILYYDIRWLITMLFYNETRDYGYRSSCWLEYATKIDLLKQMIIDYRSANLLKEISRW